jgi:hypothetical protein
VLAVRGRNSSSGNGEQYQQELSGESRRGGGASLSLAPHVDSLCSQSLAQVDDFYRFQKREKSRDELLLLREQFELDKQKVAKLKAARKFKPC